MILVVAEKPSVAATIATVLGATQKGVNYIYNDKYIVSWCLGHLVALDDPDMYDKKYAEWKFENLPIIPNKWSFTINKTTKSQFYVLKNLFLKNDVTEIVCATDAGREGECIFRYVYNMVGCKKPVKRLWTSSLESSAIKKAFAELKDDAEYDTLYQAGFARAKADWLVGINATRLFSIRYGITLNVGRVQTPTLAMIVDRNNKVKNFVKEPFYKVDIDCEDFKAVSVEEFKSEYEADKLAKCVDKSDFTVVDVTEQQKSVAPPKLYDLTALQRDANSIYGYTAQQTLDYLQSLYEKRLATYPRTDSNYITDDMADTAKSLIESVYGVYEKIPQTPTDVTKVINNAKVSDHHALLPTEQITSYDLSSLPTAEYNILFMLAVRLCVATGEDYIYRTITAELKSNNSDKLFVSKSTYPVNVGWKFIDVSIRAKDKGEEDKACYEDENSDNIYRNDIYYSVPATVSEHFTSPPKQYTDATLLSAMETAGNTDYVEDSNVEKKGLGTPATRAGIIENLVKRQYIQRDGKKILPTEKGIQLIDCVPDDVKSPKMTAVWETVLQHIEKGTANADEFMAQIEDSVMYLVRTYSSVDSSKHFSRWETVGTCPKCGQKVLSYPKSYSCENKECDFNIWKSICGKSISSAQAIKLLTKGKTDTLKGLKSKSGKSFDAAIKLNSDFKTEFVFLNTKKSYRK
ncbi:type IA DNA topoisomerase [Eubacterium sp. OM08-24]|uniref:type IA DNA topoisomerase n=1 Tax=Eubacterium sp. OM08-24 TaxID=2292352 RepID=UPI000E44B844|nr:type IA DNA topoisomerase [Eubacterium sp. OM08-24]RGM21794.1 type IA DNA topoisomerase [Eubacterium sp. OM08-24]